MQITVIGPNLLDQSKGSMHVHRAGCADLKRGQYRHMAAHEQWTEEHNTVRSVVESVYGPEAGSFYAEAGLEDDPKAWESYVGEFWFAPCTDSLPVE
jgi:hypothetical protein